MVAFSERLQHVKAYFANSTRLITCLWLIIQLFAVMFSLAAIVFAAANDNDGPQHSKSLGFAVVWMMFHVVTLSIGGTMILRKYQTPIAIGFFIGVVTMMSLNMLSLSVLCAGAAYLAKRSNDGVLSESGDWKGPVHSDQASAVFSFFMFVLYFAFAVILVKHRSYIKDCGSSVLPEKVPNDALQGSMPPPMGAKLEEVQTTAAPLPVHRIVCQPVSTMSPHRLATEPDPVSFAQ